MNLTFDLSIVHGCMLQITDTTQEYDEYLPEDNNNYRQPGRYKYSDTATINVIKYKTFKAEEPQILETIITNHKIDNDIIYLDEAYYNLQKDGHYIIDHIVLPTTEFVASHNMKNVYATDGVNIYKYVDGSFIEKSIQEILELNPVSIEEMGVSIASQETFSICHIHNLYLEECKKQLESAMINRCSSANYKSDFNTDLIWIAINAIRYNIELGHLCQAQSILEDLIGCNNLYNSETYHGCSCCR